MTDQQPSQGPERTPEGAAEAAGAVKEEGREVASAAVDQGRETVTVAAEAGTQVAGAGADGVRQVASEAASQAGQVTKQATEQARDLVQQAQAQLRDQAGSQAQKAAGGLRDVSQQVRALSEGRSDEAGIAADGARQLAQRIETLAGRIDERGFEGTVDDLRDFARRRPGLFLLGAAAAGFAVSRLGRGLQVVQEQESSAPTTGAAPADYAPTDDAPSPRAVAAYPPDTLGDPAPVPVPPVGTAPTIGGW